MKKYTLLHKLVSNIVIIAWVGVAFLRVENAH